MATPEERARANIDERLRAAGWVVQARDELNLSAGRGVAVREFALRTGFADYLLLVERKAIGAVEAKAEGTPLSGIESQSAKYAAGLPDVPPAWRKPLPFLYSNVISGSASYVRLRRYDTRAQRTDSTITFARRLWLACALADRGGTTMSEFSLTGHKG